MAENIEDTRSSSIADATGNGDVDSKINSIILALEKAGILDPN